jgi:hypothetical protein
LEATWADQADARLCYMDLVVVRDVGVNGKDIEGRWYHLRIYPKEQGILSQFRDWNSGSSEYDAEF